MKKRTAEEWTRIHLNCANCNRRWGVDDFRQKCWDGEKCTLRHLREPGCVAFVSLVALIRRILRSGRESKKR
jgi:hypothetical protein